MRFPVAIAATVFFLLSFSRTPGGAQNADAIDAPRISQEEFKELVAAKKVVIVDTRNADQFPVAHIPGAVLLPLEGRLTWADEYEPTVRRLIATTRPVVTYCA
jgi:rhodanese-related sulfurtransferase